MALVITSPAFPPLQTWVHKAQVEAAMQGHVLDRAELIGTCQKSSR